MAGADWRKLWARVSISKKLKRISDQAALLWTWAIPHFSTHGFLGYDPEDIKDTIVPKRETYNPQNIAVFVQEILDVGLWEAYKEKLSTTYPQSPGKVIIYDPTWFEWQNIRVDRIGKAPYNIKEMVKIRRVLPDTPGLSGTLQETPHSRTLRDTPAEIRSDKIRSDKEKKPDKTNHHPVDNPEKSILTQDQKERINRLSFIIASAFKGFNPYAFIQTNLKAHPEAIIKTLSRMIEDKAEIISPWPWAEHVLKIESQNFNEKDFQKTTEKDKSIYDELLSDIKELHAKKQTHQKTP